jgi:hypothetical protein
MCCAGVPLFASPLYVAPSRVAGSTVLLLPGFYSPPDALLNIRRNTLGVFRFVPGKLYVGCLGTSVGRLPLTLHGISHHQRVQLSPVTIVSGTAVGDVLPLGTLSGFHAS